MRFPGLLFLFRLALVLGCTVAELSERLTDEELVGWFAYAQLEPFGPHFDAWRTGMLASVVSSIAGGGPARPESFMPYTEKLVGDPDALFAKLAGQVQALGALHGSTN